MTRVWLVLAGCLAAPLVAPVAQARADEGEALFALVIGVNRSVDRDLPVLRYADDDGARFFDLFRYFVQGAVKIQQVDCLAVAVCLNSRGICLCTASSCTASLQPSIPFDLTLIDGALHGSLSFLGTHNIHLTTK